MRCKLDSIIPVKNEAYPEDFLNVIHTKIVDQYATVILSRKESQFPLPVIVNIKIDGEKVNLARHFIKEG